MNKPALIYDGDCGICRYWVDYWQKFTGDSVEYYPYQEVASQYPDISVEAFRKSIQFIVDDKVYSGSKAVYVLLQKHFPYKVYLWLYHHLPGFAFITEWFYAFFSVRRGLLKNISYLFWGTRHEPAEYTLTSWLFLRLLGLIYLSAFSSLAIQIRGLVGEEGILPLGVYLQRASEFFGHAAYYKLPTLFWISSSDQFLVACCIAGMIFSLFLICNVLTRTSLVVLFVLWLSLYYAGQSFLQFQWDILLLECGFLAIFLSTRSTIIVWLYRWLAFRFIFLGGFVKIASGDPAWDNLTALTYHFETQPLPTTLAWYAHHLPEHVLMFFTGATLFVELLLPFFIFLPRNFRLITASGFITLQFLIILTGNYNYFNLLSIAFCLFLFDDAAIRHFFPGQLKKRIMKKNISRPVTRSNFIIAAVVATIVLSASTAQLWRIFSLSDLPILTPIARVISPFNVVNNYGPFAVMTKVRNEIIIEGSNDKQHWQEYEFKYKPGDLHKRPEWIIPHQPRLDWQMWFAALGSVNRYPWFANLIYRLLQNSPEVTKLLAKNPFPDKPPRYIRALFYEYHFSNEQQRKSDGIWWKRSLKGTYLRAVSINDK